MLAVAFVRWWYGAGWKQLIKNTQLRLQRTLLSFSVPSLARTMFAPWKRIVSVPGSGLEAHFRAAIDNTVSRFVGFGVRLVVLLTAGLVLGLMSLVGLIQIVAWPFLPAVLLVCLVKGMP